MRDYLTEEELKNGVEAVITEAELRTLPNGTRFQSLYKKIGFRLNSKGKVIMKDLLI